jgi:outer membrane protein assembly factor BamB
MYNLIQILAFFCAMPGHESAWHACIQQSHAQQNDAPWPQWGGVHSDFTIRNSPKLADTWGKSGPPVLWRKKLGEGYSAIVTDGIKLFTAYHQQRQECVTAIDSRNGVVLWQHETPIMPFANVDSQFGPGPNATPLLLQDYVLFAGNSGQLHCLEKQSGKKIWHCDLHQQFGKRPRKEEYGYSTSPLAFRDTIIVPVGGTKAGIVALRTQDGKVLWKSESVTVSYAPPVFLRILGREQYVFFSIDKVISLDPKSGDTLWSYPCRCNTENNLTSAVACGEEHVWVAGQLDAGTRMLKIKKVQDRLVPECVWENQKVTQAHWNSIVEGETLYGCKGGNYNSFLSAYAWRTGRQLWSIRGHHLAKPVSADGKFFWLSEEGKLTMARLSPAKCEILGQVKLFEGKCWTPITINCGILYVRDRQEILAIDLRHNPPPHPSWFPLSTQME